MMTGKTTWQDFWRESNGMKDGLLRVGLTGGIASGKSTVGKWLEEAGCTVTDADRLVAELYRPGEPGAEAVRGLFGAAVLNDDGGVDHEALADRIFSDPEARRSLERAIHPLVGQRFQELVARSRGIVVFEATLLVETGGGRGFDVLVTVEADPGLRLERAVARGLSRQAAEARLATQASPQERMAAADYVLHNDADLAALRRQVDELVEALRARRS